MNKISFHFIGLIVLFLAAPHNSFAGIDSCEGVAEVDLNDENFEVFTSPPLDNRVPLEQEKVEPLSVYAQDIAKIAIQIKALEIFKNGLVFELFSLKNIEKSFSSAINSAVMESILLSDRISLEIENVANKSNDLRQKGNNKEAEELIFDKEFLALGHSLLKLHEALGELIEKPGFNHVQNAEEIRSAVKKSAEVARASVWHSDLNRTIIREGVGAAIWEFFKFYYKQVTAMAIGGTALAVVTYKVIKFAAKGMFYGVRQAYAFATAQAAPRKFKKPKPSQINPPIKKLDLGIQKRFPMDFPGGSEAATVVPVLDPETVDMEEIPQIQAQDINRNMFQRITKILNRALHGNDQAAIDVALEDAERLLNEIPLLDEKDEKLRHRLEIAVKRASKT